MLAAYFGPPAKEDVIGVQYHGFNTADKAEARNVWLPRLKRNTQSLHRAQPIK